MGQVGAMRREVIAVCIVDVWKIISVITAGEESDGWDSSMVRRQTVIVSNWKTQSGPLLSVDLWNARAWKKSNPDGSQTQGLWQHSATELRRPSAATPLSCPYNLLIVIVVSTDSNGPDCVFQFFFFVTARVYQCTSVCTIDRTDMGQKVWQPIPQPKPPAQQHNSSSLVF